MISVIIPVYNVKEYLCECVDSIINQTYTDLEIILVDDGSTDGCDSICDDYARKDHRIQVIHQENQGLSAARNTGMAHMHGDYLTFVDSDDYLMPSTLEFMLSLAETHAADMIVCPFWRLEEDGQISPYKSHAPIYGTEIFEGFDKMASYIKMHKQNNTVCGKLYASELFQEIRFPVGKLTEDVFVSHQIIHIAKRIVINETPQYVYRNRAGSIMTATASIKNYDSLEARSVEAAFICKHYPDLSSYALARLCNTAVGLTIRTAKAGFSYPQGDKLIKAALRKNLKFYLESKRARKRKIIAVLGACNLTLTRFMIRCLGKRAK